MPAISPNGLSPDTNVTPESASPLTGSNVTGFLIRNITNLPAIFVVFIIVRRIAQQISSWSTRRTRPKIIPTRGRTAPLSLLVNQQRLHHHFVAGLHWTMDEKSRGVSRNSNTAQSLVSGLKGSMRVGLPDEEDLEKQGASEGEWSPPFPGGGALQSRTEPKHHLPRRFMARPPPPPPLTPPEMSTAVFTFDDRRRSYAGVGTELDNSFIHQPNPDYMSSTATSVSSAAATTPSHPRRRSYTKAVPIGIPTPQTSSFTDPADLIGSPSSYPSTSPLLPPAPPNLDGLSLEARESGAHAEIDVQGEIISMMDDHGAGWKRHTRVYGGGVCLACAASGGEGGSYGERVRPEEKR